MISKKRFSTLIPRHASATELIRAAWLLAILAVIVGSVLPSNSMVIRTLDRLPLSDKWEHTGMYALMVFLPAIHERRSAIVAAALGAVVLGVGLEFVQRFTGWRDYEVADMIADTIGVCLGLALGLAVRLRIAAGYTSLPPKSLEAQASAGSTVQS